MKKSLLDLPTLFLKFNKNLPTNFSALKKNNDNHQNVKKT